MDTVGSGLQEGSESQNKVFIPLQGKTISFAKSSGYNTSKNKTNVDS